MEENKTQTMNIDNYKKRLYTFLSESSLHRELELLDAIRRFLEGTYFTQEESDTLGVLVGDILSRCKDINDVSTELIGELFHLDEREYQKARVIKDLAYYEVGKVLSKDSLHHTLEDFGYFEDDMDHGFYLSYEIGEDSLANIVKQVDGKQESFLRACRSMGNDINSFVYSCQKDFGEGFSDEVLVENLTPYNAGDYVELPYGVGTLCHFVLNKGYLELFAELLTRLYYPPLQGAAIIDIRDAEQGLQLWEVLSRRDPNRGMVLFYLLRNRIFKLMEDSQEYLERNTDNRYIGEPERDYGRELLKEWENELPKKVQTLVDYSISTLGINETVAWFSKELSNTNGRNRQFLKYKIEILEEIEVPLSMSLDLNAINMFEANLNSLYFYAKVAASRELNKDVYQNIIQNICRHVYSDKYVPAIGLDEPSFNIMRDIYQCLLKSGLDGIDTMIEFRQSIEGNEGDYKKVYKASVGDSIWLPVLLMMTEATENTAYFRDVVNILYSVSDFERSSSNESHLVSFYIAELIVLQVLIDEQEEFEKFLIQNVPNLHFVLKVLTANKGKMSAGNKDILLRRVSLEWVDEKALYQQQCRETTELLDQYLKDIC